MWNRRRSRSCHTLSITLILLRVLAEGFRSDSRFRHFHFTTTCIIYYAYCILQTYGPGERTLAWRMWTKILYVYFSHIISRPSERGIFEYLVFVTPAPFWSRAIKNNSFTMKLPNDKRRRTTVQYCCKFRRKCKLLKVIENIR